MVLPVFGSGHNHDHDYHHKAHHEGCLNAISDCELAHIEVKVKGDVMECWFVGGGHDTDRAVRIPDKRIVLTVEYGKHKKRELVLNAKPIELAEEKPGDCSRFEGRADWLTGLKEFRAFGKAKVKGRVRNIEIHYPEGYDPDHGHEDKYDHKGHKH